MSGDFNFRRVLNDTGLREAFLIPMRGEEGVGDSSSGTEDGTTGTDGAGVPQPDHPDDVSSALPPRLQHNGFRSAAAQPQASSAQQPQPPQQQPQQAQAMDPEARQLPRRQQIRKNSLPRPRSGRAADGSWWRLPYPGERCCVRHRLADTLDAVARHGA